MKKRFFAILTILSLSVVSCSAIDDLLTFNIKQDTSFTVNSTVPIPTPFDIATPPVTTNSDSDFKNNDTRADLVKDVKLTELKLSISNPSDKNFSFLKSVHLYISTENDPEIELAFLDDINSTSNTLNLTCTGSKLDKYIKSSSYKIRTSISTKETLTQDVTVKAAMNFKVTANPL